MNANVLIIDDEDDIRDLIADVLDDEGYSTLRAATAADGLSLFGSDKPDAVILDIWLEGSDIDGIGVLKKMVKSSPDTPVIMISGHGNIETAVSCIQIGAYDFIEKPFQSDKLLVLIRRAIEARKLKNENSELKAQVQSTNADLHGMSQAISTARQAIERAAPTSSRIFITGAPGTGKEVAARMVHRLSKRADGAYVALNCANLSPESIEEKLFGREDSSGVVHKGVLEDAHMGTLYLDEISDMPLETQAKIMRVLQEQNFQRIGGTQPVTVDVRVISSTNRDMNLLMEEGKFRQDLFYRLNVVPVHLPRLADRPEDIPALAAHFMERAAAQNSLPARTIGDDAMAVLQNYPWPGNVRQLKNVIEWILIMAEGPAMAPVTINMLPPEIMQKTPDIITSNNHIEIMGKPLREAREIFEREYLLSQVNRFGGNISKTASFIGMERSALHRKLKMLGVAHNDKEQAEG